MYLPYLRAKQFELLALRELVKLPLNPQKISPIIEPVKKDLKSIETVIKVLNSPKVQIQLIVNPENGDLKRDGSSIFKLIDTCLANGLQNVIPTFLISSDNDFNLFKSTYSNYESTGYSLIHLNQTSNTNELKEITKNSNIRFNIIHVNHLIALRRVYAGTPLAFLSDPFVKQKKNADYKDSVDEFFSNDYYHYEQEGYKAFSDYLTIGNEYIEGGMLPYAIAIHITYKENDSEDIRIRHFLSDSNQDSSDPAGKFYEANKKLIQFADQKGLNTLAINQFRNYYEQGAFPGLGVIKKLSIMHHIELVQDLLT